MNELSELLRAANKDGWSSRAIASRAEKLGHSIGHASVNNYMAGRVPAKPSEDVLRALAAVFNLPLVKLRRAARLAAAVTDVNLPPEASRLTPRQWAAVHEIIMSMVNPGDEQGGTLVPIRPQTGPDDLDVTGGESNLRGVAKDGEPDDSEPGEP